MTTLHYVVQNWFQTGCDRIYMNPLFLTRDFHKAHTNKPIIHFHIHTVLHTLQGFNATCAVIIGFEIGLLVLVAERINVRPDTQSLPRLYVPQAQN